MSIIYHHSLANNEISSDWIKDKEFEPYDVNENNQLYQEDVDSGQRYRLISKYEEHYGILTRIVRATLRVILTLGTSFIFRSQRERINDLFSNSIKNVHMIKEFNDSRYEETFRIQCPIAKEFNDSRYEEIFRIQCPIAKETGLAILRGFYLTPSGTKIPLSSGAELLKISQVALNMILEQSVEPKYSKTTYVVVNKDCLEAAQEELIKGARKVAVLMLASPIEPGGAMEEGNNGQEEDLCRRSTIFGFMYDQARYLATTVLYNLVDLKGARDTQPSYSSMINNKMIHVPQVTVFRAGKNHNYQLLEQSFEVGILVSPGLNRPAYEKIEGKPRYKRKEDKQQLLKLMTTQLKVSYDENYDTVILGAFGCGAFCNPPELIAKYYKKIIDKYFQRAFKKVIFAILDDGARTAHNPQGNLQPFQTYF
jgi:uncharacterized protein (TIGR02452 family)